MMAIVRLLAILAPFFLIASCGSLPPGDVWPDDIPPRDFFDAAWEADAENRQFQDREDYLGWVVTFYRGNELAPGWREMSRQMLAQIAEERRVAVARELASLGRRIGAEWAKANNVRLIDTRCVGIWREALAESLFLEDLDDFLTRLDRDVDALLAGELGKEDIAFERYYEEEDFEFI